MLFWKGHLRRVNLLKGWVFERRCMGNGTNKMYIYSSSLLPIWQSNQFDLILAMKRITQPVAFWSSSVFTSVSKWPDDTPDAFKFGVVPCIRLNLLIVSILAHTTLSNFVTTYFLKPQQFQFNPNFPINCLWCIIPCIPMQSILVPYPSSSAEILNFTFPTQFWLPTQGE